jgi:hypothetical protein
MHPDLPDRTEIDRLGQRGQEPTAAVRPQTVYPLLLLPGDLSGGRYFRKKASIEENIPQILIDARCIK